MGNEPLNDIQQKAAEQFARQSHRYGSGHILEDVSDVTKALDGLAIAPRSAVLDVAAGAGHTGLYLASLGHDVILSDLAAPMLERVRETARKRNLDVRTRQHAAEQLPDPNQSFDLVSCRVAAHHFSSPEAFISETARVLKPGGLLLLIDGTVEDDQPEAEEWLHKVEKFRDPSHHRFLTPRSWRDLCHANGLNILKLTLTPFKQPDLNWYFETADTSAANRQEVLALIEAAPDSAIKLFRLNREDGKIVWWWQRLTLVAQKLH